MKSIWLLFLALTACCPSIAQKTIKLQNLWAKPQVHVLFQQYTISFTVKDIDRTICLLAEIGDSTHGLSSGLDTAKEYTVELFDGAGIEYHNPMEPMLQNNIATFLLLAGHAVIRNPHHKRLSTINADIVQVHDGIAFVEFYDPRNNRLLFSGSMKTDLYNMDLGID